MKPLNRTSSYQWYLGSAFWRERREWIMKRAEGICEKCKKRRATEVHHLNYLRVFNELPTDLVALCRQCHSEIHWMTPANDNQLELDLDLIETDDEDEVA